MESRKEKIEHLLSRNVHEVIDKDHLREALQSGKKLRVKLGIDPTSPDLHLGHAVVLGKLREFQDLGHLAVLIIGDFTAVIGDPSGRSQARKPLSVKQVEENEKEYLRQAAKVIDIKKAEIIHNSTWFNKETVESFIKLSDAATMQQVLRRADFKKRLAEGDDVTLLEMLYPLFQGYDSIKVKADVELGGTDQLFNVLMGRQVQKRFGMGEQDIMTTTLLEGLDGVHKMSKSLGNYIGLTETPNDMFSKAMAIPDALIGRYFSVCTDVDAEVVSRLEKELLARDRKARLAFEIVKRYNGEAAAQKAQENFEKVFSRHEIPDDVPELKITLKNISALDLVVASGVMKSKSEAHRLIEQGGFEFNEEVCKDPKKLLTVAGGGTIRIGKKRFFRLAK